MLFKPQQIAQWKETSTSPTRNAIGEGPFTIFEVYNASKGQLVTVLNNVQIPSSELELVDS